MRVQTASFPLLALGPRPFFTPKYEFDMKIMPATRVAAKASRRPTSEQVCTREERLELRIVVAVHRGDRYTPRASQAAARHDRLARLLEHGRGRALQRAPHARLVLALLRGQLARARHLRARVPPESAQFDDEGQGYDVLT